MSEVIVIQGNHTKDEPVLKRVSAYARVSSASDEQQYSFHNQVQHFTSLIQNTPEWEYVDIYADEGVTGTREDKRGEFNRMIRDAEYGLMDIIITKSVSRFGRNVSECLRTVKHLKDIGVTVIFEEEGLDSGKPADFTMISVKAAMAEQESISTAENGRMANRQRMKMGTFVQSNPPIGYTLNGTKFEINEEQAEVIKRIFAEYLSGCGTSKIADGLMKDKIPNKYGKVHWTPQSVSYIINNPRYKGDALFQKSFKTGFPYKKKKNTGELPMYYAEDANIPIVSAEDFDKAAKLMQTRREKHAKENNENASIFTKKIYCRHCGSTYRHKNGTDTWVCRTHDKGTDRCQAMPVSEEMLKKAFVQMYNKLKANYEHILIPFLTQVEAMKINKAEQDRIADINMQIAQNTEQVLSLRRLKSQELIEPAFYIQELNRFDKQTMELRKKKNAILHNNRYDDIISKTRKIIREMESACAIGKFDAESFKNLVSRIEADNEIITFILINGMGLEVSKKEVL